MALSPLPPLASELDTDGLEQLPSRVSALELDDPSYPPSEPELDDELLSSFMSSALLDAERRSLAGTAAVAAVAVAVVVDAWAFWASVAASVVVSRPILVDGTTGARPPVPAWP